MIFKNHSKSVKLVVQTITVIIKIKLKSQFRQKWIATLRSQ